MKNNCDVSFRHGYRADRATHMAALWKRCAKRWKMDCEDNYSECEDLKAELKQSIRQSNQNLDDFHDAYMKAILELATLKKELETAQNETASALAMTNTAKQQLAALKKDARDCAEDFLRLSRFLATVGLWAGPSDVANRIIEATKEADHAEI